MSKLDVGVGDEFPAEDIRQDADGAIHHHHHYYRRPRRPGGVFRVILWIFLISLIGRALSYGWPMSRADSWDSPWAALWTLPLAILPFVGILVVIAAVSGLLWLLRCREDRS